MDGNCYCSYEEMIDILPKITDLEMTFKAVEGGECASGYEFQRHTIVTLLLADAARNFDMIALRHYRFTHRPVSHDELTGEG